MPWKDVAFETIEVSSVSGDVMSRVSQWPPRDSISETSSGVLGGLRDVAITCWLFFRACSARERPRPEEQPVINQTFGVREVDVDMLNFGGLLFEQGRGNDTKRLSR